MRKLSIDDPSFSQKQRRQKWKKGEGSSQPVTAGTGVNGLTKRLNVLFLRFESENVLSVNMFDYKLTCSLVYYAIRKAHC